MLFRSSDFTQPTGGKWISLVFIPIARDTYAFDGQNGRSVDLVQFKVLSYGTNATQALGLDDDVRTFLECFSIPNNDAKVGNGVPDGLGIIDLDNDVFEIGSLYEINSYN